MALRLLLFFSATSAPSAVNSIFALLGVRLFLSTANCQLINYSSAGGAIST
jgi:hypothetical protein